MSHQVADVVWSRTGFRHVGAKLMSQVVEPKPLPVREPSTLCRLLEVPQGAVGLDRPALVVHEHHLPIDVTGHPVLLELAKHGQRLVGQRHVPRLPFLRVEVANLTLGQVDLPSLQRLPPADRRAVQQVTTTGARLLCEDDHRTVPLR